MFSLATDALMDMIGLDEAGRSATGHSMFTRESHINYLHEVKESTQIAVHTQVLGADVKRLHVYHSLFVAGTQTLLAVNEQMQLNVDMSGPRAAPFAPAVDGADRSGSRRPGAADQLALAGSTPLHSRMVNATTVTAAR